MTGKKNVTEIKVFGHKASLITEGQHFIATKENVEGHDVVTLRSVVAVE